MDLVKVMLAAFGLGVAVYAAMETEPEEIARRSIYGTIGMAIFVWMVLTS